MGTYFVFSVSERQRSCSPHSASPPNRSPVRNESPVFDDFDDYGERHDREATPDSWDDQSISSTLALLETPTTSAHHSHGRFSQQRNSPSPESSRNKPSSRKWTPKKMALLCNMWEQEPHLYDANSRDYRNKQRRLDSIERFAAILNMDYDDVKTRMKSLRTVYKKTIQQKPTGSRAEPLTTGQRNILELCAFLKPYLQTRPARSNLPPLIALPSAQHEDHECDNVEDEMYEANQTKKKERKTAMKANVGDVQVMAEISKCMTSVAGMVTKQPTDSHTLWAQLLANKLSKIQDFEAEELKLDIDRQVLDVMKKSAK